METIKICKKLYVNAEYIITNAPVYSKGVRSTRGLIKNKNIDTQHYIFARLQDNEWTESTNKSAKFDKVFIRKKFAIEIPELNNKSNDEIVDNNGIQKAPEIIILEDNEKFTDNEGNIVEIETRGTRQFDKIYFKVKDVAKGFEMEHLYTTLIKKNTKYEINKHYNYFTCNILDNIQKKSNKNTTTVKELFLTYLGMLRLLFVSESTKTEHFIKWATEKLFTIQMGTQEQKIKLRNSLGVSPDAVREVCKKSTSSISCIYLFTLGTVSTLRKTFNISEEYDNNDIVVKYGRTENLELRTSQHNNDYGKMENVELRLKLYSFIDSTYASDAESDLANFFNYSKLKYDFISRNELAIIPKEKLAMVEKEYEKIRKIYAGNYKELITEIERLKSENEIIKLKHVNEIQILEHKNELQKEKYENEILKRDFELYKLQH